MTYYIKKSDGTVYGPVVIDECKRWAAEGRILPDDLVSTDQKEWASAPDLAELGMDWQVALDDDETYGPLHVLAYIDLVQGESVPVNAVLTHRHTGQSYVLSELLLSAVLDSRSALQNQAIQLSRQIGDARAEFAGNTDALAAERDAARKEAEANQERVAALQTNLDALQEQIVHDVTALQTKHADDARQSGERVEELETEVRLAQETIGRLNERIERETQASTEVAESAGASLEELREKNAQLEQDLERQTAKIQKLDEAAERSHQDLDQAHAARDAAAEESGTRIASLERDIETLTQEKSQAQADRGDAEQQAKALTEARLKIDELTAQLDAVPAPAPAPVTAPAPASDEPTNQGDLRRQIDSLNRDISKWQQMYERESADAKKVRDTLEARVNDLRKSENEARTQVEVADRRLRQISQTYEQLTHSAENPMPGEAIAAAQFRVLVEAHNELSTNYDTLLTQLHEKTKTLTEALEARDEVESRAREQVSHMENVLLREQTEADRARNECSRIEKAHMELVRSYRQMNDQLIRFRMGQPEPASSGPQPPKADMPGAVKAKQGSATGKGKGKGKGEGRGPRIRLNR